MSDANFRKYAPLYYFGLIIFAFSAVSFFLTALYGNFAHLYGIYSFTSDQELINTWVFTCFIGALLYYTGKAGLKGELNG